MESDGINDSPTESKSKRMNVNLSNQKETGNIIKIHMKLMIQKSTCKLTESDCVNDPPTELE